MIYDKYSVKCGIAEFHMLTLLQLISWWNLSYVCDILLVSIIHDILFLFQVKELIINKEPALLDNFLDVSESDMTGICVLWTVVELSTLLKNMVHVALQEGPTSF